MLESEQIHGKILELFNKSEMSLTQLSECSDIPVTTLKRYFSGETVKAPHFIPLCALIKVLGGSVDEIVGIKTKAPSTEREIIYKDNEPYIEELKKTRRHALKERNIAILAFLVVVVFIVVFLIYDLRHPELGYIRYQAAQTSAAFAGETAVRML